ncbi:hypothetical protein F5X96DRAFT_662958 [Biscogniauxia mediterranea]|nr:hypothetical protein F5X96DRAFT_662958 [Biscogniauxia mediterranea]
MPCYAIPEAGLKLPGALAGICLPLHCYVSVRLVWDLTSLETCLMIWISTLALVLLSIPVTSSPAAGWRIFFPTGNIHSYRDDGRMQGSRSRSALMFPRCCFIPVD